MKTQQLQVRQKQKITYDSKGLVTSGADLVATDIPSLSWSKITSGKPTTLSGYGISDAYTKSEVDGKVAGLYKYKGSVVSYSNLPTTGQITGDVWNTQDMEITMLGTELNGIALEVL